MYYHFATLLLFRPLFSHGIIGSKVVPRDVCLQAANAMVGLLRSYVRLYTTQRTPSFLPYFVLTASTMHLAIMALIQGKQALLGKAFDPQWPHKHPHLSSQLFKDALHQYPSPYFPKSAPNNLATAGADVGLGAELPEITSDAAPMILEALGMSVTALVEMTSCHPFAKQAIAILRHLAKKWQVPLDFGACGVVVVPNTVHTMSMGLGSAQSPMPGMDGLDLPYEAGEEAAEMCEGLGDSVARTGDSEKKRRKIVVVENMRDKTDSDDGEGQENLLNWPRAHGSPEIKGVDFVGFERLVSG